MSELLDRMDRGETTREEHEVDCKIEGCPNTTKVTHGRYAGLCEEHRRARVSGGGNESASSNGKGFAGQVKVLLGLARKVDRAHARLAALPDEPDPKAAVDAAIRRYQGVSNAENLAALNEAVKAASKAQTKSRRKLVEGAVAEAEREFKTELAAVARRAAR